MNSERSEMIFQLYFLGLKDSPELLLVSHGARSQISLFDRCTGHDVEVENVNGQTKRCACVGDLILRQLGIIKDTRSSRTSTTPAK